MASDLKSTRSNFISGRRRRKWRSAPDLRKIIAWKKEEKLQHKYIAIIGDKETGKYTLVRRFLDIAGGPFQLPVTRKRTAPTVLVDLKTRPSLDKEHTVNLRIYIFNFQQLNFRNMHLTLSRLKSAGVVFDVTNRNTFRTAIHCMVKISDFMGSNAPNFILVGNKIDLPEHEVSFERGEEVAGICGAQRYYECSALMNTQMGEVLDAFLYMAIYGRRK